MALFIIIFKFLQHCVSCIAAFQPTRGSIRAMPQAEVGNLEGLPQGSLNHEGDGENGVLLQSAAALCCIWLLPKYQENSLGVILTKGSFHLQRIMSCWEEQDKRQQMNREILMRYNLSQKILISTYFFFAWPTSRQSYDLKQVLFVLFFT